MNATMGIVEPQMLATVVRLTRCPRLARTVTAPRSIYGNIQLVRAIAAVPGHEGVHRLAARLSGAPADTCGFGFARGFPYFRARVPFPVRRHRAVLLAPGETLRIVLYRNDLLMTLSARATRW